MNAELKRIFRLPDYFEDLDGWCINCGEELTVDDLEQSYVEGACIHCS